MIFAWRLAERDACLLFGAEHPHQLGAMTLEVGLELGQQIGGEPLEKRAR